MQVSGGWYVLLVLYASYVLAYVDRIMLNLLVEPIKRDLGLSDVTISLLQGFSFALTLSIAALPVAHLVDTRRRTIILGSAIVGWSLGTALCGLARSFEVLLAGRMIVAMGEAAMIPCAYSLIGDLFERDRQGRAISLFSMGGLLGSAAALLFGAMILQLVSSPTADAGPGGVPSWQVPFLAMGVAGLPIAIWVFSLREPNRRFRLPDAPPPFHALWRQLRTHSNTLLGLHLGTGFLAMSGHSLMAWLPTHLVRSHGASLQDAGFAVGLALLVAGPAGALLAGLVGDRRRALRRPLGRLPLVLVGVAIALPSATAMLLMPSFLLTIGLLLPTLLGLAIALTSSPAAIQDVTSHSTFGVQHALASLSATIALGVGPTAVAFLTDHVFRDEADLGISLSIACPAMLVAALAAYGSAARTYPAMLSRMRD